MAAAPVLSPAKVILLAVRFASRAETENLYRLKARYNSVLGNELILRIILTYLPETTPPSAYINIVKQAAGNDGVSFNETGDIGLDTAVWEMDEGQAMKKVKKLSLTPLASPRHLTEVQRDGLTMFLFHRAYTMDEEAGMLNHVTELLKPFVALGSIVPTWMSATVLPLSRRNIEYYNSDVSYSLASFERLPDRAAAEYLVSQTGTREGGDALIGRDLRGMLSPFLHGEERWAPEETAFGEVTKEEQAQEGCPAWNTVMEWLLSKAARSWSLAVHAIEQWDGPCDVDFGDCAILPLPQIRSQYFDRTYTKAILASIYSIPEQTVEAVEGAHRALNKARSRSGLDPSLPLADLVEHLPNIPPNDFKSSVGAKSASAYLRDSLLHPLNLLTEPEEGALSFATGLVTSAYILTTLGIPSSIRSIGDLTLLQDHREQKGELLKLIRLASNHASRNSDDHWERIRRQVLWLQQWGNVPHDTEPTQGKGVFGMISVHDIEFELLKSMLTHGRYSLAKAIYEAPDGHFLPVESIADAVFSAALDAFDNASNPNRTKGGLKRCNDILHALPRVVPKHHPRTRQIESLLDAAHALSSYRLVLKQGEAFSPIVLRVHSDPIVIIEKVLQQNAGAYTRLQEFLEIGNNMVVAGFLNQAKSSNGSGRVAEEDNAIQSTEPRIIALCISAALVEDDFETAYSYVVSRLGVLDSSEDAWSWKAALKAGQYTRTSKTQQPTHLGTSSGNLEIRHLEQRLECLATALRVAPAHQLQAILEGFRDCEEQLDAAIAEEAARDAAWDSVGDMGNIPGSFDVPVPETAHPPRNITATGTARQAEETPMSLFDLSRATARAAQRNFVSLSSLNDLAHGAPDSHVQGTEADGEQQRQRKRDQLREAATGTLVSGVGWLIGANSNRNEQ